MKTLKEVKIPSKHEQKKIETSNPSFEYCCLRQVYCAN